MGVTTNAGLMNRLEADVKEMQAAAEGVVIGPAAKTISTILLAALLVAAPSGVWWVWQQGGLARWVLAGVVAVLVASWLVERIAQLEQRSRSLVVAEKATRLMVFASNEVAAELAKKEVQLIDWMRLLREREKRMRMAEAAFKEEVARFRAQQQTKTAKVPQIPVEVTTGREVLGGGDGNSPIEHPIELGQRPV